jgi:hypothetical protein
VSVVEFVEFVVLESVLVVLTSSSSSSDVVNVGVAVEVPESARRLTWRFDEEERHSSSSTFRDSRPSVVVVVPFLTSKCAEDRLRRGVAVGVDVPDDPGVVLLLRATGVGTEVPSPFLRSTPSPIP